MARGGIYDHLGGGFARYSTDERWLVPHFEKMLYDNALLASVYLEAFQADRQTHASARWRARRSITSSRRMTGDEGGFYSTEDADSEGEEGKYYVWTLAEINQVLGAERGKTFAYVYDVTEAGNWEGTEHPQPAAPDRPGGQDCSPRDEAELVAELAESRPCCWPCANAACRRPRTRRFWSPGTA